jgi:large subunit ribosomal protein L17
MRHGRKFNHLGRTASHRKAMLSNMASSLILHKRISTTVAKAKELRKYVEPLLTRSKEDTTHSRRMVFSYLKDKESVKSLFAEVADRIMDRPGGYTRIIKTGNRLGDNADMCMIELVDFNDVFLKETGEKKAKTRRSRRGGKGTKAGSDVDTAVKTEESAEKVEEIAETKAHEKSKPEKTAAKASKTPKSESSKSSPADKKTAAKKDKGGKKDKK